MKYLSTKLLNSHSLGTYTDVFYRKNQTARPCLILPRNQFPRQAKLTDFIARLTYTVLLIRYAILQITLCVKVHNTCDPTFAFTNANISSTEILDASTLNHCQLNYLACIHAYHIYQAHLQHLAI